MMIGSDQLPGKRFLLSESSISSSISVKRGSRSNSTTKNANSGSKAHRCDLTSQFLSGIIRSCNVPLEESSVAPKNLKVR